MKHTINNWTELHVPEWLIMKISLQHRCTRSGLKPITCPSGLAFDIEKQTCDWKAKVNNCDRKESKFHIDISISFYSAWMAQLSKKNFKLNSVVCFFVCLWEERNFGDAFGHEHWTRRESRGKKKFLYYEIYIRISFTTRRRRVLRRKRETHDIAWNFLSASI